MPAASPVRRRSGACSGDAWELHLVNTERLSDDVALTNLDSSIFPLRLLDENRLLAEIVGLSSAHALPTKIIEA